MTRRLTILCMAALLLTGALGCQAPTRYRVLCLLFDGVPPPKGLEPCDGTTLPGEVASAKSKNEVVLRYAEHGPYAAKLCEGCHLRQTNKLLLPVEDLCLNCHTLDTSTKNIHGPLAAGGCVVCHNPHGSGNEYLLVSKPTEFCMYCHKQEDILKKEVHKAGENGCTTCHDAHGSDNAYLLRSTIASVRKEDRPAAELSTQTPAPEELSTKAPAPKNGQKTSRSSGQTRPEEVKNTKSPAAKNIRKTSGPSSGQAQPEEVKSIKSPAAKNDRKLTGPSPVQIQPEDGKSIRSEAPNNLHEDIKTRDKRQQLSSAK